MIRLHISQNQITDRPGWLALRAGYLILALVLWAAQSMVPHVQAQVVTPHTHTIQPGESLSEIAELYGVDLDELMQLNALQDANAIYSGQFLYLPDHAQQDIELPPIVEVDTNYVVASSPTFHLVQPGETLSQIALSYAIAREELMALNGIKNPNAIFVGQKLRLTPVVDTGTARESATDSSSGDRAQDSQGVGRIIATRNRIYTVQSGDNITDIAIRNSVNELALRQINRLGDSQFGNLEIGQELILPATPQELQMERPQPPPSVQQITVQGGDSLGAIAQEHGLSLREVMDANYIANPDAIYVGQRLLLPKAADGNEDDALKPIAIGKPRTGYYYYTVGPGDTLSELAREFDSTVLALLEYNSLPDEETLYQDLEIRIPYGPPPLPEFLPPVPLSATRFVVSLSRQQCWVLQGDHVLHSWTCSTGYGQWITRTGTFAVQTKLEMAQSNAYELDMPYWLGIYDVGTYENGIHGLPVKWDTGEKIWSGLVGQPATFGCAMLADEDAARLFELAYLGMPVYIMP